MLDPYLFNLNSPPVKHRPQNELVEQAAQSSISMFNDLLKPFILIIGTDEDTRFLFKVVFEKWNYDVAEADDLEQSLEISALKPPDLVFMDAEFDIQKSLELMKELRSNSFFRKTGFILISGHAQENIRKTAFGFGANLFLVKPIDFNLLENSLRTYFSSKNVKVLLSQQL
jgi:DNA-binding response OmpR family regulator